MNETASHRQVTDVPRAADSLVLLPPEQPAAEDVSDEKKPTQNPNPKEK